MKIKIFMKDSDDEDGGFFDDCIQAEWWEEGCITWGEWVGWDRGELPRHCDQWMTLSKGIER